MVTQQIPPEPGRLERPDRKQRRRSILPNAGMHGPATILMILACLLAACSSAGSDAQPGGTGTISTPVPSSTATAIPSLYSGALEPGTYVVSTLDDDFDASHRITIDVPDGYEGFEGFAVLKLGRVSQTGVSAWVIGNVYADPCHRNGTLLDPAAASTVDGLVTALASQRGLHASTPTDITVDGFVAKHMKRTVSAQINLANCDADKFLPWLATDGGERYLEPGQRDLLWIVDVDGFPLVIDAALGAGTSAQDQAELLQIVESVQIDPR